MDYREANPNLHAEVLVPFFVGAGFTPTTVNTTTPSTVRRGLARRRIPWLIRKYPRQLRMVHHHFRILLYRVEIPLLKRVPRL
jgi:hypothetical protein